MGEGGVVGPGRRHTPPPPWVGTVDGHHPSLCHWGRSEGPPRVHPSKTTNRDFYIREEDCNNGLGRCLLHSHSPGDPVCGRRGESDLRGVGNGRRNPLCLTNVVPP